MRLYIDTEFNDYKGELLSIALVAEDGAWEFYEVLIHDHSTLSPWVSKNVYPVFNKDQRTRGSVQRKLEAFLSTFDEIEIVADYPADIEHFCNLLLTGPGQHINVIQRMTFVLDGDLSSKASKVPHNALEDARAIRNDALGRDKWREIP